MSRFTADRAATFIATLAVPPDSVRALPTNDIIATVVQSDLLRRYPAYRQATNPYQPSYGLHLSLSDPERSFHYAIAIDDGQVTITAPVPANKPHQALQGIHTPFTVQLEREIKRLLTRISAAVLAERIRAALADDPASVQARPAQVTRAKFTSEAIELRATLPPETSAITLLVYPAGYLHALLDAPTPEQAQRMSEALVARLQARDIPVALTKAPQPLAAERLVIEDRAAPPMRPIIWLMDPEWQTYHESEGWFTLAYPAAWRVRHENIPPRIIGNTPGAQPKKRHFPPLLDRVLFDSPITRYCVYVDVQAKTSEGEQEHPFIPNTVLGALPAFQSDADAPILNNDQWYAEGARADFALNTRIPHIFLPQAFPYHDYGLPAPTPAEIAALEDIIAQMIGSFQEQ